MSLYSLLEKTALQQQPAAEASPPIPATHAASAPPQEPTGPTVGLIRPGFSPKPHQVKATKKLIENKGKIIFAHGTGTGKTFSSIYGFETLRSQGTAKKAVVIVPAGLRDNFLKGGVVKFTTAKGTVAAQPDKVDPASDYNIVSYETFRQDPAGIMQRAGADTLIVDEMHKVRNEGASTYAALAEGRQYAKNFIGLSASPINNRPEELAPLLALSENNPSLTRGEFRARFTKTVGSTKTFTGTERPLAGIKDPAAFAKAVYPKIDYIHTEDMVGSEMPKKKVTNVYVPMSSSQYRLYQLALNELGPVSEYITRRDSNISVGNDDRIFTQIGRARQLANAIHTGRRDMTPEQSAAATPKVRQIINDTKQHLAERPDNAVVLYSNLVHGGVDVLSAGLNKAGIDHALFIGKGTEVGDSTVTETTRQAGVEEFKAGKKKVIVISGAGAEGLDLKNASAFYALDGHFNPERVLQAEARARRLGGLAERPPEERVVDVRRYQSVIPDAARPGFLGKALGYSAPRTTDEWMYDVAAKKYTTNTQYYDVMRKPYKYIRKETAPNGSVRYVYPHEMKQPTFYDKLTNSPDAQYKYELPT